MDKFHGRLKTYTKETYDLNSPLSKEIDCVNKNLLTQISTGPEGFTRISCQTYIEDLISILSENR